MDLKTHLKEQHGVNGLSANLRQIVYGGNDGIVTTFAVVAGFAGAGAEGAAQIGAIAVLVFGLANLFADATAMGLGEFLSSRSERDVYRATRRRELELITADPSAEHKEVVALLRARDISETDAEALALELEKHPQLMADFMMSYEFGMSNPDDEDAAVNALYTFTSFLVFGVIPLIPYFLLDPTVTTFRLSIFATAAALVLLGMLRWAATRENLLRCVGETVLVGGTCAVIGYFVGWLVGG